ncbi:hypothetical protein Cs7R123_32400 [Catellatospora sp. TT07R-123]|uniref:CHAT domain-containing protein n=1 Tax=Catellatospora sp. TT07R-123 TaxID=2733863 RepID=UPI001AFD099C|nr:CHAT domain-containing protein [Catellatospora sp. TT07R-123]GHJ45898.1 hypothetical protein Cs7R123_32400 [Catellatospora sp. TT07R-123]
MVSFFLSYRAGDEEFAARLIDDALTDRFGGDSVFRDRRSTPPGVNWSAELRQRLAGARALIVVIGQGWLRETSRRRLDDPSDFIRREIEFAMERQITVVPVLVGGVELPRDSDLPASLRPLSQLQYRRLGARTAEADLRQLVESLATSLQMRVPVAPAGVPLILGEASVPVFSLRVPTRPSTAVVYATPAGDLEVFDSGRPMRPSDLMGGRYSTRYEVDVRKHQAVLTARMPSNNVGYDFTASLEVTFQVTEPEQVVRESVGDALIPVRDYLLDKCRSITRQFAVEQVGQAELAINGEVDRNTLIPGGITIHSVRSRLTLDDETGRLLAERSHELRHASEPEVLNANPTELLQLYLNHRPEDAAEVLELLAKREGSFDDRVHRVLVELFNRNVVKLSDIPPIESALGTGRQPERLLVARAPTQVPVGQDLSVEVRIVSAGRSVPLDAVMSRMASFVVTDDGTRVTLTVHVPPGLHAEGPLQQTVLLKLAEDPPPIRFGFGARTPGLHRIDVTAWAGGTFLAEVSVEVSADVGGAFRDGQPKAASLGAASARPGEVTMEVRFNGSQYTFQLRSDAALFAPVVESVANTPNAAVENAIKELQQLAGGSSRSRYSATMTREVVRSAGIQLWSEMVPADIRDQFWQVGADMSAFTIATDYDLVPWELLYPLNASNDAGFLVEQVPVVRRTYGQRRTPTVGLGSPRFVVPTKAPTGVYDEVAAISAILGTAHGDPITTADELLALINSGEMGATHFACHNTFSADGSFIDMDGGRFKPALLAEAAIRKTLEQTSPLVFINACRSAGAAPTYTKMLGWAQQFMSSGAGAFVGTLWAVRTESSARFATAFYRSLADGATLGTAALVARTEQQEDPLDPTWLAYTVYGDPFATAA